MRLVVWSIAATVWVDAAGEVVVIIRDGDEALLVHCQNLRRVNSTRGYRATSEITLQLHTASRSFQAMNAKC